jgi:DNA-binding transcriptional ArsR family regulator
MPLSDRRLAATRTPSAAPRDHGQRRRNRNLGRSNGFEMLTQKAANAARMLRLLSNERRLLALCFLIERGEMTAGELVDAVGLSQSAMSQHLGMLRAGGLVTFRRASQTLYYKIADQRAARVLKLLKDIYCGDMT